MDFNKFFKQAMDRDIAPMIKPCGIALNLGAGNKKIAGAVALDYPDWDVDSDPIPYGDNAIDTIYAYHFLEHCKDPVKVLQECQRVLKAGGVINICVPYYTSNMAHMELDHKHTFTEDTWKILFKNPYYNKNKIKWEFAIGFNIICGIVEGNMCLLTQLIKVK